MVQSPSFLPLPRALTMGMLFPPNSEQTRSPDSSLFPPDGDGKEVGALTRNHSSQHNLPGILPPSQGLHCTSFPVLTIGHGTPENTAPRSVILGPTA